MTRVNSNVNPKTLKRMHLMAELREIVMVPAALRRSLRTKTSTEIIKNIPKEFTLNAGHVKFFYNKLKFLQNRFIQLANEMENRGYKPDRNRIRLFDGFDPMWYNDWTSTEKDDLIIVERINFRISQKPHLYND